MIALINNCSRALKQESLEAEFVYAPRCVGRAQLAFHRERFEELKTLLPTISFESSWPAKEELTAAYAWDAFDEEEHFDTKLVFQAQNRLFSQLPFECPPTFTPFRKKAEKFLPERFEDAPPVLGSAAREHLDEYFQQSTRPSRYFDTRNGMTDPRDSTRLSAYLSCSFLDVQQLYNRVKDYELKNGANKSTYWIVFELLWREFFYWLYQEHGSRFFSRGGLEGALDFRKPQSFSFEELHSFSKHPFWTASLNELCETGFQSNRTRQLFASFWIHELRLDWLAGAKFFEEQLIDYDVYSNYGNWSYIAGSGADPRGGRRFNIDSQLERYDPRAQYLKRWA